MTTIRRPGAASAAVLIGLTASFVTVHAVAPDWSRRAGLDVWNLAEVERDRRAAAEERSNVEAKADRAARRRETANQIAAQLVANTTTLSIATDEISEIFATDQGMGIALRATYYTAPTTRLRFARHTIERTLRLLLDDPSRSAVVSARLEEEYREMLAAHESPAAP